MTKIVVEQNIAGSWVELIELESKGTPTEEEMARTTNALAQKLVDADCIFLVNEDGYAVVVTRSNGPVKFTPIEIS